MPCQYLPVAGKSQSRCSSIAFTGNDWPGYCMAGDIAIKGPDHFELLINLKTAKALGLTILQSLLLRADEVVE